MRLTLRLGSGLKLTGAFVPTLKNLFLSANSVLETVTSGTTVGALTFNQAAGSTLSLIDNAGGRFVLSGTNINTVTLPDVAVSTVYKITVQESNAGFAITSRLSDIYITVLAQGAAATTLVAPPTLSGDAIVGGILWADDGLDNPTTTYTRRWLSGVTDVAANMAALVGQTAVSLTVPSIGGDYVRLEVTPANGEAVRYSDAVRIHFATMTAPILLRTSASGATPFTYSAQYDNTVFADDIVQVQYASDPNFGAASLLWDASRGLTEAEFATPFTADDSVDADPAWSVPKPLTLPATYFIRRIVQSLDGLVTSLWSNVESNVTLDLSIRANAQETNARLALSNGNLTFTNDGDFKLVAGRANYARTGRRTFEVSIDAIPTSYHTGIGIDDGTRDWTVTDRSIGDTGFKGFFCFADADGFFYAHGDGVNPVVYTAFYAGQGWTFGWQIGDRLRMDYTPGTFTNDVADNNGTAIVSQIRAGAVLFTRTATGIQSLAQIKPVFLARFGGIGTLKFTGLTSPAIDVASAEYQ